MSNTIHHFRSGFGQALLSLPFPLEQMIDEWYSFRSVMIRNVPDDFTREEWAYLIQFISKNALYAPFNDYFGEQVKLEDAEKSDIRHLFRPRGLVGLWLPNNVSLLGPLMLVLLSLSGCPVSIKVGSRSKNLTQTFLEYLLKHLDEGILSNHLRSNVKIESFDHTDPRNSKLAADAQIRLLFGSDEAAQQVELLPHPINSSKNYFIDRVSQGWVEYLQIDDSLLDTIIKVFAVYGQAGCTSPQRIVLIDGNASQADELTKRIIERWPSLIKELPFPYIASNCVMAQQWAKALGWNPSLVPNNHAVIASGSPELGLPTANMFLPITWDSLESAFDRLPDNIQTIGHVLTKETYDRLVAMLADSNAKGVSRLVPLARMHHFSYVWDGYAFWRELFSEIELGA